MGKCGARELNYASDVDVIFVAAPPAEAAGDRGDGGAALRTATQLAAGLIRVCSQSTPEGALFPVDPNLRPGGPAGPAGAHPGQPPGLLRALGQDLGVPGAAQGPAGGRRRCARRGVRGRDRAAGLAGAAAGELRRRRAGDAAPGDRQPARRRRPAGSSSSAPAGCATSSSRCSCSSSCTAGPTSRCASRPRCPRWPRWPPAATSAGPTRPSWPPPTASCAGSSTCSSCTSCAGPTCCPRTRPCCAGSAGPRPAGRRHGECRGDPADACWPQWRRARRARSGGCTRSCSTGRCSTRSPGCPARRPGSPRRPPRPGSRRSATPTRPGALRHIEALTAGVSRRAAIQRTLLPVLLGWFADAPEPDAGLLAFRQVSDALGRLAVVPAAAPGRHDGGPADGAAAGLQPVRHRPAAARARSGRPCSATTPSWRRGPRPTLEAEATPRSRPARPDAEAAVAAVRALRRRELLRTAVGRPARPGRRRGDRGGAHRRSPRSPSRPRWTPRSDRGGPPRRAAADPDLRGRDGPVRRPRDAATAATRT